MRGAATKARWATCEQAAQALGLSKSEVFYYMYEQLVESKLLEPTCNKEEIAVAKAKELSGYGRALDARERERQLKVHRPESHESAAQQLGMAIWFIKKAGGVEQAQSLLDAAKAAIKVLKRKDDENDAKRSRQIHSGD